MSHRIDIFGVVIVDACTSDAVAQYPHLTHLRDRALAGSVQALRALVTNLDSLSLATWWTSERAHVAGVLTQMGGAL